jgi:hypothetical protein
MRTLDKPVAAQRGLARWLLPVATAALTAAIVILDHFTDFQTAVAALYVAVVLLAWRFLQSRGVLLVAAGCVLLTLLNAATTPPIDERVADFTPATTRSQVRVSWQHSRFAFRRNAVSTRSWPVLRA